jgi:hypothetical protein
MEAAPNLDSPQVDVQTQVQELEIRFRSYHVNNWYIDELQVGKFSVTSVLEGKCDEHSTIRIWDYILTL